MTYSMNDKNLEVQGMREATDTRLQVTLVYYKCLQTPEVPETPSSKEAEPGSCFPIYD